MHLNGDIAVLNRGPVEVFSMGLALDNGINLVVTPIQIDSAHPTEPKQDATEFTQISHHLENITPVDPNIEAVNKSIKDIQMNNVEINHDSTVVEQKTVRLKHKSKKKKLQVSLTEERHRIVMNTLQATIPELQNFTLHNKIGCGTFSSVYLASLKSDESRLYAIKHHIQTALPSRIEWEFTCLTKIGGCDNICGIEDIFRHKDNTVFVMPYLHHKKFSEYLLEMTVDETRGYIRGLLTALARVHSFGIIHRDVKPSNYLYNRETKEYMLVDFGLASESFQPSAAKSTTPLLLEYNKRKRKEPSDDVCNGNVPKRRALQTRLNDNNIVPTASSSVGVSSRKKKLSDENRPRPTHVVCKKLFHSKPAPETATSRLADKLTQVEQPSVASKENDTLMAPRKTANTRPRLLERINESNTPKEGSPVPGQKTESLNTTFQTLTPSNKQGVQFVRVQNSQVKTVSNKSAQKGMFASPANTQQCRCFGKPHVCDVCKKRPVKAAPRAGTPGFRPPEVLFKYTHQTTAVDMWAAGVMLLCIMSGSYPFFKSPDDLAALAEITILFGSDKVEEVAKKLGRHVQFSDPKQPLNIRKLCEALRLRGDGPGTQEVFPPEAYDLLARLLDLNPHTRITSKEALKHPFLSE